MASNSEDKNSYAIKIAVLVALCVQNSSYSLLRRYSQGVLKEQSTSSSILLVGELMKLIVSIWILIFAPQGNTSIPQDHSVVEKLGYLLTSSKPMAVPAIIYLAMNMLSYVALERIDAGLFTVFAQTKILTTAVCSVVMLNKQVHVRKWRALLLIVFGTTLITKQTKPVGELNGDAWEFIVGVGAVGLEVSLSGLVSVYFEKVLKKSELTIWDRNAQLAVYSIIAYFPLCVMQSGNLNILGGWSLVTWTVAFLGAFGGILVAFCLKYMDSIVKCLAASSAIIITTFLSYLWLSGPLSLEIAIGAFSVILAIYNYNDDGDK